MQKNFVLTLTGPDRIGIVERLTGLLLESGGNVETSRMARLGGEFAVLMLVSMPSEPFARLDQTLVSLTNQGFKVTTKPAEQTHAEAHHGWFPYQIEVEGADHEGIIHQVARALSQHGINIESVDSETIPAPTTGTPLFSMTAMVLVPPSLSGQNWKEGLEEIGRQMNLEIRVSDQNEGV